MSALLAWGRRLVIPLVLIFVVVTLRAVGGGCYYYTRYLPAHRPSAAQTGKTLPEIAEEQGVDINAV
ncbi:MAG TPA: hypothetical protein VMW58_08400 [Anaerolineae bacterium]|nr:hypothetical protein [Anaerolineae bacterium]